MESGRKMQGGNQGADTGRCKGLAQLFPGAEQEFWSRVFHDPKGLTEVRIRAERPTLARLGGKELYVGQNGALSRERYDAKVFSQRDVAGLLLHFCRYSLYAYEDELREGYLTLEGGHRLGVAGQVALEHGRVQNIKHVTFLNLRIANEIFGAADVIMPYVYGREGLRSILIVSPPGCGKTTMLRDLIRQVSDGNKYGAGRTVGVVDERSEIGGSHMGLPQNDLGMRTDVLCGCPKALGMRMMIRTMSPDVLAVDELGKPEDIEEIREAKRCGVKLFATLHGNGREDVLARGLENMFDVFVVLERGEAAPRIKATWQGA